MAAHLCFWKEVLIWRDNKLVAGVESNGLATDRAFDANTGLIDH
jgi:hypothetical protein